MKSIKPVIYENLTNRQRMIASVEALARDDYDERVKLVKSCPKKTYKQADAAYVDMMETLLDLSLAIECDLRGQMINFLIAKVTEHEAMMVFLQSISDMKEGWKLAIEELGVNPDSLAKACQPIMHHSFDIYCTLPKPNPDKAEESRVIFSGYFEKVME